MGKLEIKKSATAGTLESSDVQVMIDTNPTGGIEIDLQSDVEKQFGAQIRQVIEATLEKIGVTNAKLKVVDRGALDCTITARTTAAVFRSIGKTTNIDWEEFGQWND